MEEFHSSSPRLPTGPLTSRRCGPGWKWLWHPWLKSAISDLLSALKSMLHQRTRWLTRQGRRCKICLIQPQKKLPLWVGERKMEVGSRLLSVGCYQKRLSSKLQRVISSDASSLFLRRVSLFVLHTDGDTLTALHRAFLPNIRVWSCFCAAATNLTICKCKSAGTACSNRVRPVCAYIYLRERTFRRWAH